MRVEDAVLARSGGRSARTSRRESVFGRSRSGLRGEGAASYCFGAGPWFQSSSARGPYPNEAVRTGSRIDAKKKRARARNASWKTLQFRISGSYAVRETGSDAWRGRVARKGRGSSALLVLTAAPLCLLRGAHAAPRLLSWPHTSFRQPCDASTHSRATCHTVPGRAAHTRAPASARRPWKRNGEEEGGRAGPALRS